MGCDIEAKSASYREFVFQSTHPHGVRPVERDKNTECSLFQSTHPHGVRHCINLLNKIGMKFQSTHPHGVRHTVHAVSAQLTCFNPRTHMGCDRPSIHHAPMA